MKNTFKGSYTIEASYIFPITFLIIGLLIILSLNLHDISISKSILYRELIYQSQSFENKFFNPPPSISKKDISEKINTTIFLDKKISIFSSLNDDLLYSGINNSNIPVIYFTNYELCSTIRTEKSIFDAAKLLTKQ